jgi:hypothetical protein
MIARSDLTLVTRFIRDRRVRPSLIRLNDFAAQSSATIAIHSSSNLHENASKVSRTLAHPRSLEFRQTAAMSPSASRIERCGRQTADFLGP